MRAPTLAEDPSRSGAVAAGADGDAPRRPRHRLVAYLDPRTDVGRYRSLHGYRAIAAVSVVVYHVAGYAGLMNGSTTSARIFHNLGRFGVATFFVLSGFLLYQTFVAAHFREREAPDAVLLMRKRFLRIWPGYLLALGVFLLLGLSTARNAGLDYYFTLFTLTQGYRKGYGFAGLPVAWTLCIEVAFYLALPLVAAAIRGLTKLAAGPAGRHGLSPRMKLQGQFAGLALMVAIGFIYRALVAGPSIADPETYPFAVFHLWLFNYLDWFALGMAVAVAAAWRDLGRPLPGWLVGLSERGWLCWSLAAAAYATFVVVQAAGADAGGAGEVVRETVPQMFVRFELNGLAAVLFVLPGMLGTGVDPLNRMLAGFAPLYLGTISYGIYLWHRVWLDRVRVGHDTGATRVSFWVALAVVTVLTLITASLSYYLVERPVLRFKEPRRSRRRDGAVPPAGPDPLAANPPVAR